MVVCEIPAQINRWWRCLRTGTREWDKERIMNERTPDKRTRWSILAAAVIAMLLALHAEAVEPKCDVLVHQCRKGKLPYRLYYPDNYDRQDSTGARYPLVLFLHANGGQGTNNPPMSNKGPYPLLKNPEYRKKYPAFILKPQCPPGKMWWDAGPTEMVEETLAHVVKSERVDPARLYVCGASMGGAGTWVMLKPLGVNPSTGRRAGGGQLGTISVLVDAQCQGYKGVSPGSFYSIPKSMNLALTVRSAGGWSSWDGELSASASIAPPASVSDAGFYSTQKREVRKLTKKVFSQINSQKRFIRN